MGHITLGLHIQPEQFALGTRKLRLMFYQQVSMTSASVLQRLMVSRGLSTFFTMGQVLPTHRSQHSAFGGLFQPTVTQAIRLLSRGPFIHENNPPEKPTTSLRSPDLIDPFSGGHLTFSTNGQDTFPAPSAYLSRRHSWVHIFPEGMIHQTDERQMRYFKWGVSRLILESEPMPDIVPIFIEGFDNIMHETRQFPRFLPRPFKKVTATFGDRLNGEEVFGDLRERWRQLKAEEEHRGASLELGVLNDALKYSDEAISIRKECTRRMREAINDLRRQRGYPDDDPKSSLPETWKLEGPKREGRKEDGSITKEE